MSLHDCDMQDAEAVRERLKEAGLRPTKQRMQLAALLWSKGCRHVTAEALHRESIDADIKVSLATIYNTLHQFTAHQLLREVVVDRSCSYFDTNTDPHHHFLHTDTGELEDIPQEMVEVKNLSRAPEGMQVDAVDVIIRVSKAGYKGRRGLYAQA
jgi:Fur family transcriptional regulator, iron response regulator